MIHHTVAQDRSQFALIQIHSGTDLVPQDGIQFSRRRGNSAKDRQRHLHLPQLIVDIAIAGQIGNFRAEGAQ